MPLKDNKKNIPLRQNTKGLAFGTLKGAVATYSLATALPLEQGMMSNETRASMRDGCEGLSPLFRSSIVPGSCNSLSDVYLDFLNFRGMRVYPLEDDEHFKYHAARLERERRLPQTHGRLIFGGS